MNAVSLAEFSDLVRQGDTETGELFHGRGSNGQLCRVTLFSADVSADAGFRSAWRHDADLLKTLRHEGLPSVVSTGEEDGRVYFATQLPSGTPLARTLDSTSLTWDEVADIGWQAASIIQHLHNSGLTHGCLNSTTLVMDDSLRAILVDSGLARWMLAVEHPQQAADFVRCCERDLVDLGRLLRELTEAAHSSSANKSPDAVPDSWVSLIADLSDTEASGFPTSAREVQGRLGGLLLDEAGESMDLVDDRKGSGRSGRSIVEELFDSTDDFRDVRAKHTLTDGRSSPATGRRLIVAAAVLAVIGAVIWFVWNGLE